MNNLYKNSNVFHLSIISHVEASCCDIFYIVIEFGLGSVCHNIRKEICLCPYVSVNGKVQFDLEEYLKE